jgi:RNA polymerase sigma factor (sigma-70 family)
MAGGITMPSDPAASSRVPFPDTAWTHVLAGRCGSEGQTVRALEELCRQYWPAIYSYLRALGLTKEEAEDVTQEFTAEFILGEPLHRADPARGSLRAYMKQSIRNYLANRARSIGRLKRGGNVVHVAVETAADTASAAPPDEAYDREWALTVMERAMTSLRESYAARGKSALFDLLKTGLAGGALQPYAAIGLSAGVSEAQIRLEVHRARRRLADALRREVAATVAAETDVDAELRYLLAVLSHE